MLGVKLASRLVDNPETLKEASTRFMEIAELVDRADGSEYTAAQLEERCRKTKNEDQLWAIKRQHFRLSTRVAFEKFLRVCLIESGYSS